MGKVCLLNEPALPGPVDPRTFSPRLRRPRSLPTPRPAFLQLQLSPGPAQTPDVHPLLGLSRRHWLATTAAILPPLLATACRSRTPAAVAAQRKTARLFFVSAGKTWVVHADGSGLRSLDFDVPNQATWQPSDFFPDGHRVVMLSMEPRRDGPGRPFEEYYTQTPTHLWAHDLDRGTLEELATRDRLAVFYTPALLLQNGRILVQVVRNKVGQIFSMNLDGSDAREFTKAGEGLPYGLSLSPDGRRVAFHLASPAGYQIWTSNSDGGERQLVAANPEHLYFGPNWSPDGEWLVYQSCHYRQDPGHDWSDLCLSRPNGTEQRTLTNGQTCWFAATYGRPGQRGGGSNVPVWTRDQAILFPRRLPDSKVPWEYQSNRPDTDHFNREYRPELARGGTEICRLDPRNGSITSLTRPGPGVWDFRGSQSSDGRWIVFCRAETGGVPSVWVMNSDGSRPQRIASGPDDVGADHPRWVPVTRR